MEDNHAISEQPDSAVVNYEEEYNKLIPEFKRLEELAHKLYNRVQELENTWMINRANFLFKVVENDFNQDFKQKAMNELENFLFPKQENKEA